MPRQLPTQPCPTRGHAFDEGSEGFGFQTAIAHQVGGRAFLQLPFEGGVEEVPEVRVGLAWVREAVGGELAGFEAQEGGRDGGADAGEEVGWEEVVKGAVGGA